MLDPKEPLAELLCNCVTNGLIVSTSFNSTIAGLEEYDASFLLRARFLSEYFCISRDSVYTFPINAGGISEIMKAITSRYKLALPTMIVLHLDETNILSKDYLKEIDCAAASMLHDSDIFFVVVQTGVKSLMMEVTNQLVFTNTANSNVPFLGCSQGSQPSNRANICSTPTAEKRSFGGNCSGVITDRGDKSIY